MLTLAATLKITFVALSLGLDVFAVCVGVGMRGDGPDLRLRIGAAFATAEVVMTCIGVAIGSVAGHLLGDVAGYLGFSALILVGAYMVVEAVRESEGGGIDLSRGWGLFVGALSISLDSLGIGFSILYIGVPLVVSLIFIALASVLSTTLGLYFGRVLGKRVEEFAELGAGIVLMATGLAFAGLKYYHVGG